MDVDAFLAGQDKPFDFDRELTDYFKQQDIKPGKDFFQSMPTGVVKGLTSIAGTGATAQSLSDKIVGQFFDVPERAPDPSTGPLSRYINAVASTLGFLSGAPMPFQAPSAEQLYKDVEENITGPMHQPQSMAGEFGQTIGEFAPSAIGGPSTMLRAGLVPAITSETAGQLTKDTPYEPYARVAGAFAGPMAFERFYPGAKPVPGAQPRSLETPPNVAGLREELGPTPDRGYPGVPATRGTSQPEPYVLHPEVLPPRPGARPEPIDVEGDFYTTPPNVKGMKESVGSTSGAYPSTPMRYQDPFTHWPVTKHPMPGEPPRATGEPMTGRGPAPMLALPGARPVPPEPGPMPAPKPSPWKNAPSGNARGVTSMEEALVSDDPYFKNYQREYNSYVLKRMEAQAKTFNTKIPETEEQLQASRQELDRINNKYGIRDDRDSLYDSPEDPRTTTVGKQPTDVTVYGNFEVGDTVDLYTKIAGQEYRSTGGKITELFLKPEKTMKQMTPGVLASTRTVTEQVPYARLSDGREVKLSQIQKVEQPTSQQIPEPVAKRTKPVSQPKPKEPKKDIEPVVTKDVIKKTITRTLRENRGKGLSEARKAELPKRIYFEDLKRELPGMSRKQFDKAVKELQLINPGIIKDMDKVRGDQFLIVKPLSAEQKITQADKMFSGIIRQVRGPSNRKYAYLRNITGKGEKAMISTSNILERLNNLITTNKVKVYPEGEPDNLLDKLTKNNIKTNYDIVVEFLDKKK